MLGTNGYKVAKVALAIVSLLTDGVEVLRAIVPRAVRLRSALNPVDRHGE